ncbi:hypothetical protein MUK42_35138 [Musa troglodytarum]|uniref:Uncharacterized protein n=1 Tax=Musa troglodytarum TaxID=320322 RepID=A0A9E7GBG8_9LILI|nr:hypothetical protein MUK42_35138 [Musa troglodytarum]
MAPYRRFFFITRYCSGRDGERKKNGVDREVVASVDFISLSAVVNRQHINSVVRVVLAGGMVELYAGAVSAQLVMEKYPGLCLTRPDVFRRPHESLVSPEERLLPGQKFYLVPRSTVKKLRQNIPNGPEEEGLGAAAVEEVSVRDAEEREELSDESICSAKDFYVSKETWAECFVKRFEKGAEKQKQNKPFTPPFKKVKQQIGTLGGWKPSLSSVKELSP